MKPIRILVTSTGSPGTTTLVRKLKEVTERDIFVVATDMNPEAGGRFLADSFYQVPPALDEDRYVEAVIHVLKKEKIDVFFPVSDAETPVIAKNKKRILDEVDTKIIINDYESIVSSNNKHTLYETLRNSSIVEVPEFYFPKNLTEFIQCAELLGYPDKKICFKPPVSKGLVDLEF